MDEREKRLAEKMEFAVDGIWLSHKNSFGLVTKEPASWQVISLWSECLRLMAEREWVKVTPETMPRRGATCAVIWSGHIQNVLMVWDGTKFDWPESLNGYYDQFPSDEVTHWREIVLPTEGGKE